MSEKRGGWCVPFADSWDHVAGDEVYFRNNWRLHTSSRLATIDMGQKLGGSACRFSRGIWVPIEHNIAWVKARPTSIPSGILVHPAVWPQPTMAKNLGAVPL